MTSEPAKPVQTQAPAKPPMLSMPKWLLVGCGILSLGFLVLLVSFGAFVYWETHTEEGKKFAAQCEKEQQATHERAEKRRAEERAAKAQRDKEEANHWVQEQNLKRMNKKYYGTEDPSPEEVARRIVGE